ncbi:unnamed protein product, partial [Porites evermanni]
KENFPNSIKREIFQLTSIFKPNKSISKKHVKLMLIFNMKTFARVIIIVFLITTVSSTFRDDQAEVRRNADIQVPEGCHWPSH